MDMYKVYFPEAEEAVSLLTNTKRFDSLSILLMKVLDMGLQQLLIR